MKEEKENESVHSQLKEKINVELWHDFLSLCEKYKDIMKMKDFLYAIICFSCRMVLHCCPSKKQGYELIKGAIKYAIEWDKMRKIMDKNKEKR